MNLCLVDNGGFTGPIVSNPNLAKRGTSNIDYRGITSCLENVARKYMFKCVLEDGRPKVT
jgi:hypothetical protein